MPDLFFSLWVLDISWWARTERFYELRLKPEITVFSNLRRTQSSQLNGKEIEEGERDSSFLPTIRWWSGRRENNLFSYPNLSNQEKQVDGGRVWDLPTELKSLWDLRLFQQLSLLVKVAVNLEMQIKEKCNFYLIMTRDLSLEISQNIRIKGCLGGSVG